MPREVLRRARLDRLFGDLLGSCGVLVVSAAPGSGKTVQAQLYGQHHGLPVSWITLDSSHSSPRRLLTGLGEALRAHRRADADVVTRSTFHFEATLEETAALAAGSVLPEPALLVVDECEHLDASADAQIALETFLEYRPEPLQVLLLSRTDLAGPLQRRMLDGRIGLVTDDQLRLTAEENQQLGELLGGMPEQRDRIREATGGWTAGAAFSFRYGLHEQHISNDLPSVIMNDVLSELPAAEQQFLLDSSVPDVVTREAAAALCGGGAHALWDALRSRHLPATTMTESTVVYHSLFRSFLHRQLLARDPQRHVELVRRYARYLLTRRHAQEATELYLSVGELAQAQMTAETAVADLCERSDWDTFLRWADRLGRDRLNASPRLLAALIRSLFGQRRFEETVELIRTLDRRGLLRAAMEADQALLATAAWALQSDPAEARRLLDRYQGDYRADVVRFMLRVCTDLAPAVPPLGSDWGDVERIMSWGLLLQGRVNDLGEFVPSDPDAAVVNPNVILASVFGGRISEARDLWNRVPQEIRDRPQSHFVEALLLLSEGETELALAAIQVALTDSRKTTFFLFSAYEVLSGYILFRLGRNDDAVAALQDGIERTARSGQTAILEWGQMYLGFALLLEGRAEAARPLLHECVHSMSKAHRRLFLPTAAACLSEAEARCGDLDAAHEAADLAYHTAALMGTFSALLPALRSFPEIARREDARDPGRMRWRRLVIAPSARPPRQAAAVGSVRLGLQPFGPDRDIWVNGAPQKIGRIKIIELMALLVLHPDGIDRARLHTALFPDATLRNGGNHFRQIAFKFRQITGLSLDRRDGNLVGLPADTVVDAADVRFEELLRTASWVTDDERVLRLQSALDIVRGPYLGGSNLGWAEERRHHLDVVQEEARLELVRLLVELGQPQAAREECEKLLAANRYSDPGYRLLVQIERMAGSESSVLAVYRRAVVALGELGLEPGDARRLLEARPAPARRAAPSPGGAGRVAQRN
jgi:ATP/maltotriose-dependent transcriptional regulator MalT/DNA-binding SARP family transcriptional activator